MEAGIFVGCPLKQQKGTAAMANFQNSQTTPAAATRFVVGSFARGFVCAPTPRAHTDSPDALWPQLLHAARNKDAERVLELAEKLVRMPQR